MPFEFKGFSDNLLMSMLMEKSKDWGLYRMDDEKHRVKCTGRGRE